MKKIFLCFLGLVILFSCMTGCSDDSKLNPKKPVTLSMWHIYGEQTDSPLNPLVQEFNATVGKEKGIVIKVTNMTTTPDLKNQLLAAKEGAPGAPSMPDLFSSRPDTVLNLGAENLVDFNDYFSEEELSQYVQEFVNDGTIDGHLAVFPVSRSTRALFINDSLFYRFAKDTGVSYEMLDTWEGFFEVAAKYYEWSGGKSFCAFDYLIQNVEYDMLASGHEPVYNDADWYDTSDPNLKASWMKFAVPLAKGHIVVSDKYANTQIMTGEVAAGVGSSAAINYYNDTVTYPDNTSEKMNLKVLPLPKTGSGEQFMPVTGTGFSAYKTTEAKAEAAAIFLRWLTEGERNLDFVVESGYMPVHDSAFEAIDGYEFPSPAHKELFSAVKTMRKEYTLTIRPEFTNYYNYVEALYPALKKLCPALQERADSGEDAALLAEETWDLFLEISKGGD